MKVISSESVFRGHPDKICDQISDAILDACLLQDSKARVAVECLIKDNSIIIAGEVTMDATVDYSVVARSVLKRIGIKGQFDVLVNISEQSRDIKIGVDSEGAGDQGMMFGYATNENEEFMPTSLILARKISMRMDELTKPIRDIFGADGKCQVSVLYDKHYNPIKVTNVVISQQTKEGLDRDFYTNFIKNECIFKVIPSKMLNGTSILINPTGEFSKGGSYADCGLTGRKIIVDTYGGVAHHGGGAFSGKDATKVDRAGAYYCRYVAKNIVASGLAKRCEVNVNYAIGVSIPTSIGVDTFGTGVFKDRDLLHFIQNNFDFTAKNVKELMTDDTFVYESLASYGHFGRSDLNVPWERLDKVKDLKHYLRDDKNVSEA